MYNHRQRSELDDYLGHQDSVPVQGSISIDRPSIVHSYRLVNQVEQTSSKQREQNLRIIDIAQHVQGLQHR